MNYDDTLKYIHSAPKVAKKLGNAALATALKKLGNPHKKLKYIHIAGTNGKGSTSAMTDSVLRKAGYTTGLFTSPYIERFNERIKVNGNDIPDAELVKCTEKVKKCIEEHNLEIAEFSIIFLVGILYFLDKKCDIVVLETGLGGRLDATNVIEENLACAITSIGFDHVQYLGNTIEKITYEKAGIIKNRSYVVLYPNPDKKVLNVVSSVAKEKDAHLIITDQPLIVSKNHFIYQGEELELSLEGKYQFSNASVCLEIINTLKNRGYTITAKHIKDGLKSVCWPGRFEWLNPNLVLDGCHNEEGVDKFAESAKDIPEPVTIVTGVMSDKDYRAIAEKLSQISKDIIITKPSEVRSLEPDEFKKIFAEIGVNALVVPNPEDAVNTALKKGGVCAVCGSLYLIGEIRKKFKNQIT